MKNNGMWKVNIKYRIVPPNNEQCPIIIRTIAIPLVISIWKLRAAMYHILQKNNYNIYLLRKITNFLPNFAKVSIIYYNFALK